MECGNYFSLKFGFVVFFFIHFYFLSFLIFHILFHNDSLFWPCEPYETKRDRERKRAVFNGKPIYFIFFKWIIQKKRKEKEKKTTMKKCVPPVPVWFPIFFSSFLNPSCRVTTWHLQLSPHATQAILSFLAMSIHEGRPPILFFTKCVIYVPTSLVL